MADGEKVHILIVDDIPETRENIRKLLQFESDFEVVGAARSGKEGIDLAKELRPDVVLMDINMQDLDGISATEAIRKDLPFCQIVILSVQGDPDYMRKAMLAGARDFLTKPPSVDEMNAAIRRAGRFAQEERAKTRVAYPTQGVGTVPGSSSQSAFKNGKIIVVYSPKGGIGSTTIATNLAVTLQKEETPVILVDGDVEFGDVAVFLNQQPKNSIADLSPRADELDPQIINEVTMVHTASGIKILAAPIRPEYAEQVRGEQFARVLEYLRSMYSYVVVDTSSSLSDVTLAAIDQADVLLLLTSQEIPAIKDARLFLDLLSQLKIPRERVMFVMNRFDKRIGITPEKISENFKQEIVAVLPYDEKVVLPSINRGVPFMIGDKSKPISRSLFSLTENIRHRLTKNGDKSGAEVGEAARQAKR